MEMLIMALARSLSLSKGINVYKGQRAHNSRVASMPREGKGEGGLHCYNAKNNHGSFVLKANTIMNHLDQEIHDKYKTLDPIIAKSTDDTPCDQKHPGRIQLITTGKPNIGPLAFCNTVHRDACDIMPHT